MNAVPNRPLLLVGAGKMGGALLAGWLAEGLDASLIHVQDPSPPPEIAALLQQHGIVPVPEAEPVLAPAVIVLAVKPQLLDQVLPGIAPLMHADAVLLSIVAGKTLAGLGRHVPEGTAIVRAMPNTPAAIGRGVTVACANEAADSHQREECEQLLRAGGTVLWIDTESQMDAVTAVSGSGPAYVFLLTECLGEVGTELGLSPALAQELARITVTGAGELMRQSMLSPEELRRNVTSPNGVTAAALEVLMGPDGMEALFRRALARAAERSRALSS